MSDIGYKSFAQKDMDIRYDSLDEFLQKIKDAILIPFEPFEDIGLKKNSEWLQISTGRLQIENEYYDSIRPKRVGNKDLRPYEVLLSSGIEYVEVRGIDLSPNEPVGISKDQIRLLDLVLIYCIILDSPLIDNAEAKKIKQNESAVISNGNNAEATIFFNDKKQFIGTAKQQIVEELKMLANVMPNSSEYINALKSVENKNGIIDSLNDGEIAFTDYGMLKSKLHKSYLSSLENSDLEKFKDEARESWENFDKLNTLKEPSIDEFINSYNSKL
jgi:glutamate--cysteine ligase